MDHVIFKERKKYLYGHTQTSTSTYTHTIKLRDRVEQCREEAEEREKHKRKDRYFLCSSVLKNNFCYVYECVCVLEIARWFNLFYCNKTHSLTQTHTPIFLHLISSVRLTF